MLHARQNLRRPDFNRPESGRTNQHVDAKRIGEVIIRRGRDRTYAADEGEEHEQRAQPANDDISHLQLTRALQQHRCADMSHPVA
jgi:hypothetical protein